MSRLKIPRVLSSVRSLYAAVGILFLTVGVGSYVDMQNESMHARHREINSGLERMVRLNQELTGMLAIAVLRQSALGTASYDTVKADLQQTMTTVVELTKTLSSAQDILSLADSQARFREFEGKVIQLITDDKWDAAAEVLFGDDYMRGKKTYEVDSESAVSAVMGELANTAQRFSRIKDASLGLRIASLFLLLWIGVMFSRRSRADLAEQMRLRDEITAAYRDMEARVVERTLDLEKTAQNLAIENAEREMSDQRTRLILNSAGEGIFGVDANGQGVFFNAAAIGLLGHTAEEMVGREIHRVIHDRRADGTPLPPEQCPMHIACVQGLNKTVSGEVLWRKDGSSFLSEYSVTPMVDSHGANSGAVVVFRDITEQRRNQEELQQRMAELERFNRLTMGREERMIQLKREINALLQALGREKKYRSCDAGEEVPASAVHPKAKEP